MTLGKSQQVAVIGLQAEDASRQESAGRCCPVTRLRRPSSLNSFLVIQGKGRPTMQFSGGLVSRRLWSWAFDEPDERWIVLAGRGDPGVSRTVPRHPLWTQRVSNTDPTRIPRKALQPYLYQSCINQERVRGAGFSHSMWQGKDTVYLSPLGHS